MSSLHLDRLDDAEEAFRKAISVDGKFHLGYYQLARLHCKRGNIGLSKQFLEEFRQLKAGGATTLGGPEGLKLGEQ